MTIKAEYIWIDGTEPTPLLRSKTKVLANPTAELPIWGFDGSSTNQAPGKNSDCVLKPVFSCPDPIRGGDDVLVMSEVLLTDMTPHPPTPGRSSPRWPRSTRTRSPSSASNRSTPCSTAAGPLGFPEQAGYPAPQGPYYCGVGADDIYGRPLVEAHLDACLEAGLSISGINAEVMPGQWEFQVGPVGPLAVSDQLWVARWLLHRLGEELGYFGDVRPEASQRGLERCRMPHQLLDQSDARVLRSGHHRG